MQFSDLIEFQQRPLGSIWFVILGHRDQSFGLHYLCHFFFHTALGVPIHQNTVYSFLDKTTVTVFIPGITVYNFNSVRESHPTFSWFSHVITKITKMLQSNFINFVTSP